MGKNEQKTPYFPHFYKSVDLDQNPPPRSVEKNPHFFFEGFPYIILIFKKPMVLQKNCYF